jgi:uncharacterized OsmC-like protein
LAIGSGAPKIICVARFFRKTFMTMRTVAAAMDRFSALLKRRPGFGLQDDAPATARWQTGLRTVSSHENGLRLLTDMPVELGGTGTQVTPGWLLRASLASCAATRIAMAAAAEDVELAVLEVSASSRSDVRGLFGMADHDGRTVDAGPKDVVLTVRIAAHGLAHDRLRAIVEAGHRCSPVSQALSHAVPILLNIDLDAG